MRWTGRYGLLEIVLLLSAMGMPGTLLAQNCFGQDGLQEFGSYNQRASDVAITGNYALTADLRGLTVYDITDVSDPQWTAELALPGEGVAITLDGTVAWVALGGGGLSRVDITDPAHPQLVDPVRDPIYTEGTAFDVAVEPNRRLGHPHRDPALRAVSPTHWARRTTSPAGPLRTTRSAWIRTTV